MRSVAQAEMDTRRSALPAALAIDQTLISTLQVMQMIARCFRIRIIAMTVPKALRAKHLPIAQTILQSLAQCCAQKANLQVSALCESCRRTATQVVDTWPTAAHVMGLGIQGLRGLGRTYRHYDPSTASQCFQLAS